MEVSEQLPPQAVMIQLLNDALVSHCVSLVAELGVVDFLQDGPKTLLHSRRRPTPRCAVPDASYAGGNEDLHRTS